MRVKPIFTFLFSFSLSWFLISCEQKPETLFRLVPPEETAVNFINTIEESDTFNILTHEYIYNGGGVGIADFNNDGLQDVFFAGNLVSNKLYLNKGKFKFTDISDAAGVDKLPRWCSGVSIVDINADGWMDIYLTVTMNPDSLHRRNILFVNKGVDEKGIPTFEDMAQQYNIDDAGYSVHAAFFDYDLDNDLDLYILTNQRLTNIPSNYRTKILDGSSPNNDRFYRNNGDGTFTNVSKESGITIEGFGLGLAVSDFNSDGWPDLYVANDYLSNDILYINNGNGTFTNRIKEFIGHQSQFSMGNDVADINNDALPDIITLDMLPETSYRKKTTIGGKSYQTYIYNEQYGYEYQYGRNMLHLNNGLTDGIKFSEIGQLSGVYQTEWSWSPLFADFDNDGDKDLIITNGFPKDVTDKDFANYRASVGGIATLDFLVDSIPVIKVPNYAFQNNGDLFFSDVTAAWGFAIPSFSNGAAFSDLDNDGDLDYVVNNINDQAFVYENTLNQLAVKSTSAKSNYIRLKLKDKAQNSEAMGAKIKIYTGNKIQFHENTIYRGYLSSVENVVHFGLGDVETIDSLIIEWPNGDVQTEFNVSANQVITIEHSDAIHPKPKVVNPNRLLRKEILREIGLVYKHEEEDKIDFNLQRTLPHKFSQSGPGIGVGDINGDGLDDLYIGGSSGKSGTLFIQDKQDKFNRINFERSPNNLEEDQGILFFDADLDSDLDLYIVSGSVEAPAEDKTYQDRLYFNDGKGQFKLTNGLLPDIKSSGSCARAADFDADGDLDLFVAGRVVPGAYPVSAQSYLLRNDGGKFINVTEELCPALVNPGMITDALWSDFDNDGKIDLILTGEFSPIQFFKNKGSSFEKISNSGIENFTGWWNSISAGDFDRDGDVDYVIGNLGLNNNFGVSSQYPLKVFAKDFDGNGSIDPVMACYSKLDFNSKERELCTIHFWDELNSQSPRFRQQFSSYKQFGRSRLQDVLHESDLKDALILEANQMASGYVENLGQGKFKLTQLPTLAQVGPINGLVCYDINNDANLDVLIIGNDYGNEVFAGRYDAITGLVLLGDGKGSFEVVPSSGSGFLVDGDAKGLARISGFQGDLFIATQNRDSLKVFRKFEIEKRLEFSPEPLDSWAELIYADGKRQKVEFYYGSGFLSQSTRKIRIPEGVNEIVVYNYKGESRKVTPKGV